MTENAERLWFQDNLNRVGIERSAEAIERVGRALPCSVVSVSGQIVTVKFEVNAAPFTLPQITIPIATSKYDWVPLQAGDTGITVPGDVYLGGISGLGGGVADLTRRGNLSTLVFVPVSIKGWTVPDASQRVVQGPTGVLLRTQDNNVRLDLTESGITFTVNGKTWSWGTAGLTMSNGVVIETHIHDQGNDSHGDTEVPTGGPVNP